KEKSARVLQPTSACSYRRNDQFDPPRPPMASPPSPPSPPTSAPPLLPVRPPDDESEPPELVLPPLELPPDAFGSLSSLPPPHAAKRLTALMRATAAAVRVFKSFI